jgi:hypothetical protein
MRRITSRGLCPLALIVLPALLGAPAHAAATKDNDLVTTLHQADGQFLRGDFKNACKGYLQASEVSKGASVPGWIGLSRCYTQLKQGDKAVAMARKAQAAAVKPEERNDAMDILGEALLHQPDAAARSEAVTVYQDELKGSKDGRGRAGSLAALLATHRDAEAATLLQSMRTVRVGEGQIHSYLCEAADILHRTEGDQPDALNDRLRALDPDAPLVSGGKVKAPVFLRGYEPDLSYTGVSGTAIVPVTVVAVVNPKGNLQDFRAVKWLPMGLDERAINSLTTIVFTPASLNGAPVPACYLTTINIDYR